MSIEHHQKETLNGHRSFVVLLTGLSGAGKSTLAYALEDALFAQHCRTAVLDGDSLRLGLSKNLQFSSEDRAENLRRMAETTKILMDAGVICIAAFIAPLQQDRANIKHIVGSNNLIEIYCHCSLAACEKRDVKGLYKRARAGNLKNFTGIDSLYEAPLEPNIFVDTENQHVDECVAIILDYLSTHFGIQKLIHPAENNHAR